MGRLTLAAALLMATTAGAAEDERELVTLPEMMREHMLSSMRDHLRALDDIFAALADGKSDQAGRIAEERIGMSSLDAHGAAHMAPYMPEGMRNVGTSLHHAASRFTLAAQEAELDRGDEARRKVFSALHDITAACNACHRGYRVR
jgi:hypothetical protein